MWQDVGIKTASMDPESKGQIDLELLKIKKKLVCNQFKHRGVIKRLAS